MTPDVIGQRIAEARLRAGRTQSEVASEAALDRSALAKAENGARRVSALELARIASALGERVEWFLTDPPQAIVSHRNITEPGTQSTNIDRMIEHITRHVEFVQRYDEQLSHIPPGLERPGTTADAETAATQARVLLDLHDGIPLHGLTEHAAALGLWIFSLDIGSDAADAASILLENGGVATINGHLHVGRRRLAAAHELGHYLFADEYTVDWTVAGQDDSQAWEARLDRFARALLLPQRGLHETWTAHSQQGDSLRTNAVKTASIFRVDMSTLARRGRETGLLGEEEAGLIRRTRTTRTDIVDYDLVPSNELAAPTLPSQYQRSVLRLYRDELVSAARAIELLLDTWTEDELPALPQLPETAIWQFVS